MSQLEGYSYYQQNLLDALDKRLKNADSGVKTKVDEDIFDIVVGTTGNNLGKKDNDHFLAISNLKKVKADVTDYNSRVQQLDGNDAAHTALMNSLESDYNGKASKAGFEEKMKELNANDATHDVRLDALERQFDGIESRVLGEVNDKVNELALNTDFNALVAELQAKDTELGNKILQLATEQDIRNAVSNYQTALAGFQTKPEYNTEIGKLVNRHRDFEDRFTAIDQFFRVMAETYKLYNSETGDEIVYNAMSNNSIELSPENEIYTIVEYGSYSGVRSLTYSSQVKLQFTQYGYNTLDNVIKVLVNNMEVGSISKSDINSVSLIAIIPTYATVAQLKQGFTINKMYSNGDVDTINSKTYTASMVSSIPEISPLTISYETTDYLFMAGESITIAAPTVMGTVSGYSVSGASGLTISSSGIIGGSITTGGKYEVTVIATGSNGLTSQATIFITVREFYNLYPNVFNGTNIEDAGYSYKTLQHTFTSGNAGTYGFYLHINNEYSLVEEYITKLYKVDTTNNLLVNATDLSGVLAKNGTIYFNAFFTNTSSTPNFNVTLEANTVYYLECLTLFNDSSAESPPYGADVSVSIENNGTPVVLSLDYVNTDIPILSGDRNSISFTSPLPNIMIKYISNIQTGKSITYVYNGDYTPNSLFTYNYTTPISPVFKAVEILSGARITSRLLLPEGTLPSLSASGDSTSLDLTFTPNISPFSSSATATFQFFIGTSWVTNSTRYNIANNTPATITVSSPDVTATKARIVFGSSNHIATQEVDISALLAPTRTFYELIRDKNPDGTGFVNPGFDEVGIRYFRHYFDITQNGNYNVFLSADRNEEEVITAIYKEGTSVNLANSEMTFGLYAQYSTISMDADTLTGINLNTGNTNTTNTPNFTLTGLTAGRYYIIAATLYNNAGVQLDINVEDSAGVDIPFIYEATSSNEITIPPSSGA